MSSEALNRQFVSIPTGALIVSVLLHLGVPLLLLLVGALSDWSFFAHKLPQQDVYQTYIQVDVVGLPDLRVGEKVDTTLPVTETPAAQPKPQPAQKTMILPVPAPKPQTAPVTEKKVPDAKARRSERERALKQIQEEARREAALNALQPKAGKSGRAKLAGNVLSKGTAMTGAMGSAADAYRALVTERIREHFNFWQKKKGLKATVNIELFPTGMVRRKTLVKPSTNALFNSAVLQAVDEAQPFPLPQDLSLLSGGIFVDFNLEDRS